MEMYHYENTKVNPMLFEKKNDYTNTNKAQQYKRCHENTWFRHMQTTKVQISLRIHAVWLAPLLFTA